MAHKLFVFIIPHTFWISILFRPYTLIYRIRFIYPIHWEYSVASITLTFIQINNKETPSQIRQISALHTNRTMIIHAFRNRLCRHRIWDIRPHLFKCISSLFHIPTSYNPPYMENNEQEKGPNTKTPYFPFLDILKHLQNVLFPKSRSASFRSYFMQFLEKIWSKPKFPYCFLADSRRVIQ